MTDEELSPSVPLVGALLASQHPDLGGEEPTLVAQGWDNAMFLLGDSGLCARLPVRAEAASRIGIEQRWLPLVAPRLPLPVPVPVGRGTPGCGYPWPWSIVPWLPGRSALHQQPDDSLVAARGLADFLRALHHPALSDAPVNPYRGGPLASRGSLLNAHLEAHSSPHVDAEAVRAAWRLACSAPPWAGQPVWLHGDLHPHNMITDNGRLAGVVDFGDLCSGDPATDMYGLWALCGPDARAVFRDAYGVDDAMWARARGWAIAIGVAALADRRDPRIRHMGLTLVTRAVEEALA